MCTYCFRALPEHWGDVLPVFPIFILAFMCTFNGQ